MEKIAPFLASILLAGPLAAQDLGSIGALDQAAPAAAANPRVATVRPAATATGSTPIAGHYALADIDAYIAAMAARLSMRDRPRDPFGLSSNPSADEAPIMSASNQPVVQAAPKVPFADIVQSIRVTAIMPGDKKFLVGSRAIREGDVLPLVSVEGTIQVRVLAVTAGTILFENTDDKTTATLHSQAMPQGMSRAGASSHVPGMQPNSPSAPLKVDVHLVPNAIPPR